MKIRITDVSRGTTTNDRKVECDCVSLTWDASEDGLFDMNSTTSIELHLRGTTIEIDKGAPNPPITKIRDAIRIDVSEQLRLHLVKARREEREALRASCSEPFDL